MGPVKKVIKHSVKNIEIEKLLCILSVFNQCFEDFLVE